MALSKTITTKSGLEVVSAYHRVENLRIIGKSVIAFDICIYKDGGNRFPSIECNVSSCGYEIDGENPIAQAYGHLKILPEFAGAENC